MTPADVRLLRDAEVMRRAVAAIPAVSDGRVHVRKLAFERLWVKPGRHCHAAYRMIVDTERGTFETFASAALVRDAGRGAALLREVRALPTTGAPWPPDVATALVDAPCALVQLFPWDHRLPTLAGALDTDRVGAVLGVAVRAAAPVGYWPGMRCQLRYETENGLLFGKVFPDASGGDVAGLLASLGDALAHAEGIAVPALRAWVPSLHLLVTTPLDGEPLLERLAHGATPALLAEVAAALARLHTVSLATIARRFDPDDDLEVVRSWVAFTTCVFPELGVPLAQALDRLERARPSGEGANVVVHRDFYDKQVLVGARRVGVLDLDTLCHGDAEIDVGNFCAHLVLRGLQWHDAPDAFAELGTVFVGAYREHRSALDRARLEWYRASTLLRLACVYALRPRWAALAPRLAQESGRALG